MAPERLWEADELRRAMFERPDLAIFVLEADAAGDLTIVDANESALASVGYARDELIGRPLATVDPEVSRETVLAALRELECGRPIVLETRHRRKDGSFFDVEVRGVLVRVAGRGLVLSVELDLSERKRAQARLAHSHALMDYVIGHARSAIAVHDRELRYIYVSDRYLKEYKVAERDVIGKHHYDVFPDLPQKWRDAHQRALRGEVSSAEEDPYQRADGTVEWTRWECRPWYESDGSIGGIIVYTEVITDRKRAEEERRALEAQLQQAMKMEAVGRLAGGIAHDFNNLLTAILGNADFALRTISPADPLHRRLREIGDAAQSAASLTRQLLAFSRKQVIEPRVLDLSVLAARLERLLQRLLGEDVQLRFELSRELAPVKVDPGQLEQVLVNLAVNARDAMPGGGELVIRTADAWLDEAYCSAHSLAHAGEHVVLSVSDTGEGMTEEVKRHIFEPFFTTKTLGRGTGLGLATTFGIVRQAGGSIEVDSEVGCGTTFKIYLPAVPGQASPVARPNDEPPRGCETVLLVEDDEAVRRLAHDVLASLGYAVVAASDGTQALARLEEHPCAIDLVVTDVVMPGMNGRVLAEKVARIHPRAKVLYASGYTDDVIAHQGVLHPGVHFIAKPYTPRALADKVRDVLGARTAAV